jgi:hypothetical protein
MPSTRLLKNFGIDNASMCAARAATMPRMMRGSAFLANGKMRIRVRIVPALVVFSDNLKPFFVLR